MRRSGKRTAVLALLAAASLLVASMAHAELVERGNLFVKFEGGIAPTSLPRHSNAPISVRVAGTVRTLSGERPPALRWISIAINRGGKIDTRGLPRCRRSQIKAVSSAQALDTCRSALVGQGRYLAGVTFPEQQAFPLRGRILAFNAREHGERVILAHIFGNDPFPNSRLFVFHIHKAHGTYGTILSAALPAQLNRYGYLKEISLDLERTFVYRGRPHSYLSAACAAPSGARIGIFPFVRVGMTFADGRKLSSALIRTCRVRGG